MTMLPHSTKVAALFCGLWLSVAADTHSQFDPFSRPRLVPEFGFVLPVIAIEPVLIEASSDLFDWSVIGAIDNSAPSFIDSEALSLDRRFYRLRQPAIVVLQDASLNITETRLEGVVDDPQFTGGKFDLSLIENPMTFVGLAGTNRLEVIIRRPGPAFGGNDLVLSVGKTGRTFFATATLVQWADFPAYGGQFSRRLRALSGTLTLGRFSASRGAPQPNSARFELVFAAGTVKGTYFSDQVQ